MIGLTFSICLYVWCWGARPALTPGATTMRSTGNSASTVVWIPCTSGPTVWDSIILSFLPLLEENLEIYYQHYIKLKFVSSVSVSSCVKGQLLAGLFGRFGPL